MGVLFPFVALNLISIESVFLEEIIQQQAVPAPRCRLMNRTPGRVRSWIALICLGFPGETIRPCSRQARLMSFRGMPAR